MHTHVNACIICFRVSRQRKPTEMEDLVLYPPTKFETSSNELDQSERALARHRQPTPFAWTDPYQARSGVVLMDGQSRSKLRSMSRAASASL